jgi:hypothetical protein
VLPSASPSVASTASGFELLLPVMAIMMLVYTTHWLPVACAPYRSTCKWVPTGSSMATSSVSLLSRRAFCLHMPCVWGTFCSATQELHTV